MTTDDEGGYILVSDLDLFKYKNGIIYEMSQYIILYKYIYYFEISGCIISNWSYRKVCGSLFIKYTS